MPEARGELTVGQRALFTAGSLGSAGPGVTLVQLQPYFSKLGYHASVISNIRFFSLFFDALLDPIMGYVSDHTLSRFGRRMPYIAAGSLLLAAGLVGMWWAPPGLTTAQFYVYLVAMQALFTVGITMTGVPYQALIPELAKGYAVRTALVSWMQAGTYLGSIWGGAVRAYANWRGDEIAGFREFAVYCSLIMVACFWIMAVFLKEPPLTAEQTAALRAAKQHLRRHLASQAMAVGRSLWYALGDRQFRILFLCVFTYQVGVLAGLWMYPYLLLDWFGGTWDTGFARRYVPTLLRESYFLWIFFGITCGIVFLPFWNWLGKRWEKRTCLMIGILGVGAAYGISYVLFAPKSFPLLIVYCLVLAFVYCPANIFPPSMLADIATHSAYRRGEANEGMFYGAWSFLVKLYNAAALFWTGFALDHVVHYRPGEGVVQTAETLHRMRLLYAFPPLVAAVAAAFVLRAYQLDRRRMAEITAALDARAKVQAS